MPKFMKIEVETKLILTVPSARDDEEAADVVLVVERHINEAGLLIMDNSTHTHVGVRIHCHDFKTLTGSAKIDPKLDCVQDQICPDCKAEGEILKGPSGGMNTNVKCGKCGSEFNITPHGVHRI